MPIFQTILEHTFKHRAVRPYLLALPMLLIINPIPFIRRPIVVAKSSVPICLPVLPLANVVFPIAVDMSSIAFDLVVFHSAFEQSPIGKDELSVSMFFFPIPLSYVKRTCWKKDWTSLLNCHAI
jgi:hypothetical protein